MRMPQPTEVVAPPRAPQGDAELASLFERVPAMLCTLDAGGLIRRANGALASALGVSAAELHGRVLGELAHPADRARLDAALARALAGEADV